MPTSRDSSMETTDRYPFGYTTELARTEPSASTAKRLRQRLQRQQSGQSGLSGRRYTGESSECSSLVGTPTDTGRSFTFGAAQRVMRERSTCAMMNTLHMAVAHKQRDIVELLLKNGYDPNLPASCHCKGNCTATGNIPLTSIIPRTHSMTPELCSTCSQLRVVSIVDQTPLGVAVRSQSSELIALLIAYGADVNLGVFWMFFCERLVAQSAQRTELVWDISLKNAFSLCQFPVMND
ncbi:unnamed protein product [Caenorhabditis sp. 36 PRJEB53466]|nr:unnamed protein product [Caenorhabditis sp. 36 PRJEB53466]